MGRKQKERQKKKNNQKLLAAATAAAAAAATTATATAATASSGNAAGVNNSATAVRSRRSSSVVDVDIDIDIDVDVGVAAAKKGATMEATTMAPCYHGSTAENITKGSNFQMAIDEWFTICMHLAGKNPTEILLETSTFDVKYKDLMKDPEFSQCVFAVGTDMFKNSYRSEAYSSSKRMLQNVLTLGITSKYTKSPLFADGEKFDKYCRDIHTNRGIINVLFRETNTCCNCMTPYKEEAKAMEKLGMCDNCRQKFPKMHLKRCSRCLSIQYCSKECMKQSWPTHKQFCTPHNEQTLEE